MALKEQKEQSCLKVLVWSLSTKQWIALSTLLGEPYPLTVEEKKRMIEKCVKATRKEGGE